MGHLAKLVVLALNDNQLRGEIPSELGRLANLVLLDLSKNQLSGTIPFALGHLAKLTQLGLSENQLSGPIPPALGDLAKLTRLRLNENQLSGSIPLKLGRLSRLQWLRLSGGNQFSGCMPKQLGAVPLSDLDTISLEICSAGESSGNTATVQTLPPVPSVDRAALTTLYHATNGANWTNNSKWLIQAPIGGMVRRHHCRRAGHVASTLQQPVTWRDSVRIGPTQSSESAGSP